MKGHAQIWTLDFETASGYTTSVAEFTDGSYDFWLRTDGTNIGSNVDYNGKIGNYYFAGMDLDGDNGPAIRSIYVDDIDISGQTNLEFRIYLAEDDANDGDEDWDGGDYFHVDYDIDNSGTYSPLLWVESAVTGTNGAPLIDTDFDEIGDGTEITSTFVQFSVSIPGTGSLLDLQLEFSLDAGDEDIAIDQLEIYAAGGNSLPVISNVTHTPAAVTSSDNVSVSADVTDSDGTITSVELHWGTVSGSLTNTITMSNTGGDTYTTDSDIPAQVDGTTVYYEIAATDDASGTTTSAEFNYTVVDPATTTLPYNESFDTGIGDCYTYNVAGVKEWYYYAPGQLMNANGFGGSNPEEDWLILPGIDFDSYSNEIMTFTTYAKYGTNNADNYLKLLYSTDYPGVGDPTGYTWTELTWNQPSGINIVTEVSAPSGIVDLSGISGSQVFIAFKYYSTDSPTRWGVDDISIGETLGWYNLQWPGSGTIFSWWYYDGYAQCWQPGVTDAPGQGAGINCWIGYSLVDEDPSISTNFTWVPATYNSDQGNNDEYKAVLGAAVPMAPGVYYYAARWQYNGGPYHYGGFQGGPWNGIDNVSGVLTIDPSAPVSTWTGAVNDNWFDAGNWDNGVPGYNTDAIIPTGLSTYPKTTSGSAMCNNILLQSDASGDALLVEYGNLIMIGQATVERYMTTDQYHSFSPVVENQTANIFHLPGSTGLDVYLYGHNELNNADPNSGYFEITDVTTPLVPMAGYAVWADGFNATPPVDAWTFTQTGVLNAGPFGATDNMTRTGAGVFAGFNYAGNPYPSSIDWEAVAGWTKVNLDNSIWSENNGNWAQYVSPGPGINGGSNIIAPGQGFFVSVSEGFATGTLMMDNDVRTTATTPWLKSTATNFVKLAANGNGYSDEMVVRFDDQATEGFDPQFDGIKLPAFAEECPQIFVPVGDKSLSYVCQPETNQIPLSFTSGSAGSFTISLADVDQVSDIWLEDTFTGQVTDLKVSDYTFNYTPSDPAERFVLHFSPLGIETSEPANVSVFTKGSYLKIFTPVAGQATLYTVDGKVAGQFDVAAGSFTTAINQPGIYIVRFTTNGGLLVRKVHIQ
ncbi:MAG: hypothetical protein Kow00127_11220 [Bacteroidales bacterium]